MSVGDLAAVAGVAVLGYYIWQKYDPLKPLEPVAAAIADAADTVATTTEQNVALAKLAIEHPEVYTKSWTIGLSSLWSAPIGGI